MPSGSRGIPLAHLINAVKSKDVQVSPLAVHWNWIFVPSIAHRLGDSGALLFKSAMAPRATGHGNRVFGLCHLGSLVDAKTTNVSMVRGCVSGCGHLVEDRKSVV